MEEKIKNLSEIEVRELITKFPIKPRNSFVYITMNKSSDNDEDVILEEEYITEEQFVIAVGDRVHDIEPGMKVLLDPEKMTKYVQDPNDVTTKIPALNALPMEVNGYVVARVTDNIIHSIDFRTED
jgi:uncharacterized protein YueI